jgi:hypothetical protein
MMEGKPDDGHRKTILDPDATHVGVGWAHEGGSFRMAQEFMTRRLSELTLSRAAQMPATILVEGKVAPPYRLEFVTLAREPVPTRLTKAEANARTSYGYPNPRLAYVAAGRKSLRVVGAETEDRLQMQGAGGFSFRFTPPQAKLWTILTTSLTDPVREGSPSLDGAGGVEVIARLERARPNRRERKSSSSPRKQHSGFSRVEV